MTIAISLPNERVLHTTSVPVNVGLTAAGEVPQSSKSVPPPVFTFPPLISTSPPLTRLILVEAAREMAALTLMLNKTYGTFPNS